MKIGDTIRGNEIGKKYNDRFIWTACPDCQNERWVRLTHLKRTRFTGICSTCNIKRLANIKRPIGDKHPQWKGGRFVTSKGYVFVLLRPDDFFFPMATRGTKAHGGYVLEHRLVMAKHLGRCIQLWEKVHHKNGIKGDNKIGNLELTTLGSHIREHHKGYRDGYQKGLTDGQDARIKEVKKEIKP